MIALITPTGGRPIQFKFCQHFMKNQTYKGEVVWVIVDDCWPVSTDLVKEDFKDNWTIIKVYPKPVWRAGWNTQGRNIKAGIDALINHTKELEAIFIIEDDDCYKTVYIEKMIKYLMGYSSAGEKNSVYYNVFFGGYVINDNTKHSSLFQTVITMDSLPWFEQCLGQKFIDFVFFSKAENVNLFNAGNLAIGMKGLPGRYGIGAGHTNAMFWRNDRKDPEFKWLQSQIGDDASLYYSYNKNIIIKEHASFQRRK